MNKGFSDKIIEQLNLELSLKAEIESFLMNVSYYKLVPYINLIKEYPELLDKIKASEQDIINAWDVVCYLYFYNIQLSTALYPYIVKLETILKNRINNLLTQQYSDYWFRDEALIMRVNKIDNISDIAIYNKYKMRSADKAVDVEMNADFHLINDQLKNLGQPALGLGVIKKKVAHIKRCGYLFKEMNDAVTENSRITCLDFIENKVTFGYWNSILSIKFLWDNEACLHKVFPKADVLQMSRRKICSKLDNIRILRNRISHYSRILGKNQIKDNMSLADFYNDIIDIFNILDIKLNDESLELKCPKAQLCSMHSFTSLYEQAAFIHNYEIKPQKIENHYSINMENVESTYLQKAGYDSKDRVFQVEFERGEVYQYFRVPSHLYDRFQKADSKGKYFIKNIRENFQYKRIN